MGGPNKAAYVFGTAARWPPASGRVMAAVMVGGMVLIAIALSTTFCPKKWSPDERRSGIVNYVMGLCFVTEGAIPYAPLTRCASCPAASSAPRWPVRSPWCSAPCAHPTAVSSYSRWLTTLLYVVALIVGSVVGAVILSLLKKGTLRNK